MHDLILSRRQGLENHLELMEINSELTDIGKLMAVSSDPTQLTIAEVAGNEDFGESLKYIGSGMLSVSKWVGGKTYELFNKGLRSAGAQLIKTFDDNTSLIRKVGHALKESEYAISIDGPKVGQLTSTGKFSDFNEDLDTLIKTTEMYVSHSKSVLDYLERSLITVRGLSKANNSEDILKVIDAFNALNYPIWELPNNTKNATGNSMSLSEVLPGGKVIKVTFDKSTPNKDVDYSMSGDKPAGEAVELQLSSSEIKSVLNKLDKLNELHKRVKQHYDQYLAFIKNWSDSVKAIDNRMSDLDNVGKHVIGEAEQLLKGNSTALAFYSGFTPRVINYTDKYIQYVLSVFGKLIN